MSAALKPAAAGLSVQQWLALLPVVAQLVLLVLVWQAGILTSGILVASLSVVVPLFVVFAPMPQPNSLTGLGWGLMVLCGIQETLAWYVIFMP
jgi:hypothetical protein